MIPHTCCRLKCECPHLKRVYLTSELVDNLSAPESGEVWLADSEVVGFGVRLWSRSGKIGKAYAVRVPDAQGRVVRKALKQWELAEIVRSTWRFAFAESDPTFGQLLPEARLWARDEIDRIAGRPTLDDEMRSQWARSAKQARKITLARASEGVLTNLTLGGRSQAYRDRLDKLFATYVPEEIQKKPVVELTSDDISLILKNENLSHGNMRVLRPFIGKCLGIVRQFHGKTHESLWDFERRIEIDVHKFEHPLAQWKCSQFDDLINYIMRHDLWQQGLCLALYLETRNSLRAATSARWKDFVDVSYVSRMEPERQTIWRREWQVNGREGWSAQVTIRANAVLERIGELHAGLLTREVEYLFPSRYGRQHAHVRSVEHVWRHTLTHFRLPYLSPRLAHILYEEARWGEWRPQDRLYTPPH